MFELLHDRFSFELDVLEAFEYTRKHHPELGVGSDVRVLADGYPLTYVRGDRFLVTVNPSRDAVTVDVPDERIEHAHRVEGRGVRIEGRGLAVDGFGYAILDLGR